MRRHDRLRPTRNASSSSTSTAPTTRGRSRRRRGGEVVEHLARVAPGLHPLMGIVGVTFLDGVRRVNRAPAILAGVWLLTCAVTLPLAPALRSMIVEHLGSSLAADAAANGVNYE